MTGKKTAPFINGGINRASFMALLAITSLIIILAGIATQSRMREPAQSITENINSNASVNHKINNPITALAKSGNNWSVKTTQNQPKNQLFYSADEPFRSSAWYKNVSLNGCNDTYIYPTPYIIKFSKKSLNIGTQLVNSNGSTIITKKDPDLIFEFTDEIKKCEVTEVSQLGAKFKLTNDKGSMTLNIVKGLAYIEIENNGFIFNVKEINGVRDLGVDDFVSLVFNAKNGSNYALKTRLTNQTNQFKSIQSADFNNQNISNFTLGLIPNQYNDSNFNEYISQIPEHISNVNVEINSDFKTATEILNANQNEIFVLLPHQYQNLSGEQALNNFQTQTIHGDLKFAITKEINLAFKPSYQIPDMFKAISLDGNKTNELKKQLALDTKDFDAKIHSDEGIYWKGKTLAKYANLMHLANSLGENQMARQIQSSLNQELADLFTYSGNQDKKYFYYDENLKTLLSSKPEFGHEDLNDHHFHYGYYLYTLAVLNHYDNQMLKKYESIANYLADDAANFNEQNKTFPYLRYFDLYDGKSNASGLIYMTDGNNQESTSEAANFWYSGYLVFNDLAKSKPDYQEKAQKFAAGYIIETQTINYHYFNTKPELNIFPKDFNHKIVSIVFEGKKDFATWFTADPNAIHGIQVIPVTPGSIYLRNNFYSENFDSQIQESKNDLKTWQDMTAMYLLINKDLRGIQLLDQTQNFDSGNSKSWSKYMEYYFNEIQ